MFVLEGMKRVHHREKSWLLTDGKAVLFKNTAYQQERFTESEWEVLCFYVPNSFMKQTLNEYRTSLPLKNLPPPSPEILLETNVAESTRAFFYSVIPYFTKQPPPAESLLELKFKELLFNIFSNPANKDLLSYVKNISESSKPSLWEIMEANFSFNLSLAEFARLSHRSLAAFKREFSQVYHTTRGKWLLGKRLGYASHLLETSGKNINEITEECGAACADSDDPPLRQNRLKLLQIVTFVYAFLLYLLEEHFQEKVKNFCKKGPNNRKAVQRSLYTALPYQISAR